jgi:2-keto-4-pentenoate hydratase
MADAATAAAELLLAARRNPAKKLADLPLGLKPADRAAAYAIQRKVAASFAGIGGWKVSPFGADAPPMCGALPAAGIVASPATLSSQTHAMRGIEAEISVRIGRDLPPRGTPYGRDEIVAAIAAMHPAIEVLESRFIEPSGLDVPTALADSQAHGGFVHGKAVTAWQGIDLARESVEQFVDGAVTASRTGHPAGDLVAQVVWLANEGSVWAGGLKAGQFVTCGSWTGAQRVGPTASVRVKFSSVGEVLLNFTP